MKQHPAKPKPGGKRAAHPPARSVRRAKIAAALVAGKTITRAARELRLSRQWTSHEAHEPETAWLLAEMLAPHEARIRALVGRCVETLEDALSAGKVGLTKEGTAVDLGPDHYARLQAVKRLLEMLEAARRHSDVRETSGGGLITMDRLRAVFEQEPSRG